MSSLACTGMKAFREVFSKARNIVVLSGAGVSAASGVPTYNEFWNTHQVRKLTSPETFLSNPSLVWEYYNHLREATYSIEPNAAHKAITELQHRLHPQERRVTVVTLTTDGLHTKAGSENVLEVNGSLYKTRCTKCGHIQEDIDISIPASLKGCVKCSSPLRPDVVWTGESHNTDVLYAVDEALKQCDLFLQVGTSSRMYPAAAYGRILNSRGVVGAEFNISPTPYTGIFGYSFQGKCTETLPKAVAKHPSEP